jgi:hypothetical protein
MGDILNDAVMILIAYMNINISVNTTARKFRGFSMKCFFKKSKQSLKFLSESLIISYFALLVSNGD